MQPTTIPSKIITRTIGLFLLIGGLNWLLLLLTAANLFRSTSTGDYQVSAGPLVLNTFSRHVTRTGTTIGIRVESGLLPFFLTWAIAGLATGLFLVKFRKR
jgi:hypothetical protein